MTELGLHAGLTWLQVGCGAVCLVALLFITAPYGRHVRKGWGLMLPARIGWLVMELPPAVGFLAVYLMGQRRFHLVPLILLALWETHYAHRTFIFPWRLRVTTKKMPVAIVVLGLTFNSMNTYVNARWISALADYGPEWLLDPRFGIGVTLFVTGLVVNLHADSVLLALRQRGETGYSVPHGGLYRWISCPNYLGELVEWTGWAVATWSLPGLAFVLFALANLLPRALSNHRWYRETFSDYPRGRRALIPFVL